MRGVSLNFLNFFFPSLSLSLTLSRPLSKTTTNNNQPENILVDAKGHLCLADMGLSKILGTGEDAVRTSTVCGTRAYLAPEMVLRKPYGMSVDFWQFGCFIFELYAVSGSPPPPPISPPSRAPRPFPGLPHRAVADRFRRRVCAKSFYEPPT